jgi:hypothetical protein
MFSPKPPTQKKTVLPLLCCGSINAITPISPKTSRYIKTEKK